MAWMKAKTVMVAVAAVLVAATTVNVAVEQLSKPKDWRGRFEAAYGLSRGQVLKHIASPFIPERLEFYQKDPSFAFQARNSPTDVPTVMIFEQSESGIKNIDATWGGPNNDFGSVICDLLKIRRPYLEGPEELLDLTFNGDWTIRAGTSQDKTARELESIMSKDTKRKIHIQRSMADRPVVVVRGSLKVTLSPIDVYVAQKDGSPSGSARGTVPKFVDSMATWLNVPFVNETSAQTGSAQFRWIYHLDSRIPGMKNRRAETDILLKNLAAQTGLSFSHEIRRIEIWTVSQD